jgi:hypothetical protein
MYPGGNFHATASDNGPHPGTRKPDGPLGERDQDMNTLPTETVGTTHHSPPSRSRTRRARGVKDVTAVRFFCSLFSAQSRAITDSPDSTLQSPVLAISVYCVSCSRNESKLQGPRLSGPPARHSPKPTPTPCQRRSNGPSPNQAQRKPKSERAHNAHNGVAVGPRTP